MKKILLALLFAAFAQNIANAEQKFAIINAELIIDKALVSKNVSLQLDKKKDELKNDVEKKEQDLGKLNQELVKQESILSKDIFEQKVKDFNNTLNDVQRDIQSKKNILEQAHMDSMAKIIEEIHMIVKKISTDKNISVVLPSNSTAYFAPDLDITSEVLTMLDKKIQKIEVKFDTVIDKKK
jgi:Skp family chaperone for outer membrane proteins